MDLIQLILCVVPVITIPVEQKHFQVSLGTREFVGASCLTFERTETRLQFRQNIEHAFQVALRGFEPLQGFIAAGAIQTDARGLFKETAALVNRKAPGEAKAFNGWLAQIATTVAEAGTEGGFLGFGGVKVSDVEKATLAEISEILNA